VTCNNVINIIQNDQLNPGETKVPFIFNYLANYCELTERITPQIRNSTIEKVLLSGIPFLNVQSVDAKSIELTKDYLCGSLESKEYKKPNSSIKKIPQPPHNSISDEIKKYETALNRLEELFLFSEETMSQKDFLIKKKQFQEKILGLKSKEKNEHVESVPQPNIDNEIFIHSIIILREILLNKKISFTLESLIKNVGTKTLHQIVHDLISKIVVKDNTVQSIAFRNGLVHSFIYKPGSTNKAISNIDVFLDKHQVSILSHVKKYGFIDRKTVRIITGCDSTVSETAIRSLVRRKKLVLMRDGRNKQYILPDDMSN